AGRAGGGRRARRGRRRRAHSDSERIRARRAHQEDGLFARPASGANRNRHRDPWARRYGHLHRRWRVPHSGSAPARDQGPDRGWRRFPRGAAQGAGRRLALGDRRARRRAGGHLRAGADRHAEPLLLAAPVRRTFPRALRRRRAARRDAANRRMSPLVVHRLQDEARIRAFLLADFDYAAYALGDLEPPYADHAAWYGAAQNGAVEALALVYDAVEPPVLFLMGDPPALDVLLAKTLIPGSAQFLCRPGDVPLVQRH